MAFNHVVGLSKVGKTNEAIEALEKVDSTFLMASGIEDPDLDLLRGHPEFISLCARAEELADL